jgi:hypothetical protein
MADKQPKLIDRSGVRQEYGISIAAQTDLSARGEFCPCLRVGGKLYYRREELEHWLDSRRVVTTPQGSEVIEMVAHE